MIVVEINRQGVTIDGHAGFAEHGKDIVCAGVSTLAVTLAESLTNLTQDKVDCDVCSGHMEIHWEQLSDRGALLVDSFFLGICWMANSYPDNVFINNVDGRKTDGADGRKAEGGSYEV